MGQGLGFHGLSPTLKIEFSPVLIVASHAENLVRLGLIFTDI
jgi:hypothetical protein